MKCIRKVKSIFILFVIGGLLPLTVWAAGGLPHPSAYLPSTEDIMKQKSTYDDQKDLVVSFHPKDFLPPEVWASMNWDVDKMKALWAELVGFRADERVGKLPPGIKLGKYTYKDVEENPALKALWPTYVQKTLAPGGPPLICNIMSFELEPTRQFHLALPAAEVTKKNLGKTKLDKDGYIVPGTWDGGIPFPRPSGQFKAQQVYYNFEKRVTQYEDGYRLTGEGLAFDKTLTVDKYNKYARNMQRLMGRTLFPPFGWFDDRAEKRGEFSADAVEMFEPRANRGLVTLFMKYDDPLKMDPMMIYLPQLRRIRKMSATDTQDPNGDQTYDDMGFWRGKISPKRFPYKFDIIEERDIIMPWSYNRGAAWLDSKNGYAIKDMGCQIRPCYVLQWTQMDPNYIYSKRIYYMDQETFVPAWAEFYDQKGRLYRTYNIARNFIPECGQIVNHGLPAWQVDYVDTHSSIQVLTVVPAQWERRDFNMENLIKKGK